MKLYTDYNNELNSKIHSSIEYKPFGILKICYDDGTESIPLIDCSYSQGEMYTLLNDEKNNEDNIDQLIVDNITQETFHDALLKIKEYYENLSYNKGYEGIMIKPQYVETGKLQNDKMS